MSKHLSARLKDTGITGLLPMAFLGLLCATRCSVAQTPVPGSNSQQASPPTPQAQSTGASPSLPSAPSQVPSSDIPATLQSQTLVHGTIKSGATPLPGVTITATNTLTGKRFTTATDVNGNYSLAIAGRGRYVVRADFAAFAAVTKEVVISSQAPGSTAAPVQAPASNAIQPGQTSTATSQQIDFALVLASRQQQADARQAGAGGAAGGHGNDLGQ